MRLAAVLMVFALLAYFVVELGWGGGDPKHPGHNPPGGVA